MNTKLKVGIIVVVVLCIIIALYYYFKASVASVSGVPTSAVAPKNPFIGSWGNGGAQIVDQGNGSVMVNTNDGRHSPGTVNGNSINVQFQNDPGCCTGTFNNNAISWSNGSSWTKDV